MTSRCDQQQTQLLSVRLRPQYRLRHCPSAKADSFSESQVLFHISDVHYHVHKNPSFDHTVNHMLLGNSTSPV
jgi:hypothetical protein